MTKNTDKILAEYEAENRRIFEEYERRVAESNRRFASEMKRLGVLLACALVLVLAGAALFMAAVK